MGALSCYTSSALLLVLPPNGFVISVAAHVSYRSHAGTYGDSPFPGRGLFLYFIIQF